VSGLLVTYVAPRSAADLAGIAPGDILTAFNGSPFSTFDGLALLQGNVRSGVVVTITLLRSGTVCRALVRNGQQLGIDGKTVEAQAN
jgi:S1-C subfamily serine protease